jgi:hypothetical protein
MVDHEHELRIHIDREPRQSPNPTTGAALYALANIGHHKELFREESGDHEDELVPNDGQEIRLKQDEHFYSQKDFEIIINGKKRTVTQNKLSFDDLVKLAGPIQQANLDPKYLITYSNGPRKNPEGTMVEGQSVKIKSGMVFSVKSAGRS